MGYDLTSHSRNENPYVGFKNNFEAADDFDQFWEMEFKLHNCERFNSTAWLKVITLAKAYGWEPLGTKPGGMYYMPDDFPGLDPDDWDGNYWSNDYQVVTAEDAAALANALERALDDIPDHKDMPSNWVEINPGDDYVGDPGPMGAVDQIVLEQGYSIRRPNAELHPFEFFGGEAKQHLIDFIAFCRKGAFTIG